MAKNNDQIVLSKAAEVIKSYEGLELCAYPDGKKGRYSVGYGNQYINGLPVEKGTCITKIFAEHLLEKYIKDDLVKLKKDADLVAVTLTVNQQVALLSYSYNLGYNTARTLRVLLAPDACKVMKRYSTTKGKWNQGLYERRMKECLIYKGVM